MMFEKIEKVIESLTSTSTEELVLGAQILKDTTEEEIQTFVDNNSNLESVKKWSLMQDIISALTKKELKTSILIWDKGIERSILFQLSGYDQNLLERDFAFESLDVTIQYQNEAGYGIVSLEAPNEFIAKVEVLGGSCHTTLSLDISGEVDSQELLSVVSFFLDDWTSEDIFVDVEGNELGDSWNTWYVNSKLKLITDDDSLFPNFEMFEDEFDNLSVDDYECGFSSNSGYMENYTILFSNSDVDVDVDVSIEFLLGWMIYKGVNIAERPTLTSFENVEKQCVLEVVENTYSIPSDDWNCLF